MLKKSDPIIEYDYESSCTFFLAAIIVTLLCQFLAGIVSVGLSRTYPDIAKSGDFNTAFMIAVQVANAAFILLYTKLRRYKFNFTFIRHADSGRKSTPSVFVMPVLAAAALMVAMYLPTTWYGYLIHAIGVPPDAGDIDVSTVSSAVMIVIASVFLAPCCEETVYRGVLLHGLDRQFSSHKAVLLSALAFMLMHMNPLQVVFQFALGVASGYIALETKRLLPSVILHASANAIALVMQMTALESVLAGCVDWLTHNVAAAVFITLGLFVGGGAIVLAIIKFGFDLPRLFGRIKNKKTPDGIEKINDAVSSEPDISESQSPVDSAKAASEQEPATAEEQRNVELLRKKSGTFKYRLAIGICAVMLIANLAGYLV